MASGALATDAAAWRGAGTGPFVLESFEPGARLVLTRDPGWWGTGLYPDAVDRIEQVVVPSREAAAELVLRGEADFFATQQAPPGLLDRLEAAPGVRVKRAETANIQYFGFDLASPELRTSTVKGRNPFADRRVREAIYRAVDFEGLKAALGGLAAPAGMILGRTAAGWGEELDRSLPYDPEAARRLLAEAGYPDGFGVALDCAGLARGRLPVLPGDAGAGRDQGRAAARPTGEVDRIIRERGSDFYNWGWIEALDSILVIRTLYHSGAPYAAPGVASAELDALIDAAEVGAHHLRPRRAHRAPLEAGPGRHPLRPALPGRERVGDAGAARPADGREPLPPVPLRQPRPVVRSAPAPVPHRPADRPAPHAGA